MTRWTDLPLLDRTLLADPPEVVAPRLLGALLVTREVVGRVVEVEAYGPDDPASHSVRGERPGNVTMFRGPGRFYVYVSYGVHHLGNVVCGPEGTGAAVLLRGVEVLDGLEVASQRRGGRTRQRELAAGPGRLSQAFALSRDVDDDTDLLDAASRVTLRTDGTAPDPTSVRSGPRTGVVDAPDVPWRWWLDGSPGVSPYRRHPLAGTRGT